MDVKYGAADIAQIKVDVVLGSWQLCGIMPPPQQWLSTSRVMKYHLDCLSDKMHTQVIYIHLYDLVKCPVSRRAAMVHFIHTVKISLYP